MNIGFIKLGHKANNKNNLRIAMLGHKHMPSREGGVEIVVEELSTRMVAAGHKVTCYNRRGHHISGTEFDSDKLSSYKGVTIKNVFTIEKKGLAALTSSFFASLRAALGPYDVVHIHAEGPAFFSWLPKLFGKRVVVTIHGLDWQREKWAGGLGSKFIHIGEKSAVKYADEIIVLSKNIEDYFKKTYNRSVHYIPNGVSSPNIIPANLITSNYGLGKDSYFLYLGRLVPEKGIIYLIEAFKRVDTNKKLVIAGGASDTNFYVEKIKNLAKEDSRIIFTGFVQDDVLAEIYSNAYVYVLPSDLEGMPLSLLEAMSYSNCCIVSDIPECLEVIEDKAISFQHGNIDDLTLKIQKCCENPLLVKSYKDGAEGYITSKYNWDEVVSKTLKLYNL